MSTRVNQHHSLIFYFLVAAGVLTLIHSQLVAAVNAASGYVYPKNYLTLNVNSGVYSVSFSSSCSLVLGYISYSNYNDLDKLATSVPSTFTVISKGTTYYSNSYSYYSLDSNYYFVLFNNGSSNSCYASTFSVALEMNTLSSSTRSFTLPYGITKTFSNIYSYNRLVVTSSSSSSMSLYYKSDYSYSTPTTTPNSLSLYSISRYGTANIPLSTSRSSSYTSYVYLSCGNIGGCPVTLSLDSDGSDSGASTIIGAIVGPIAFVVIFTFIVIISVVSTCVARRRRMLMLAAATSAVATTTTYSTQPTYVPVPTPVSTTTTTTENTTVYVPPPVTTTAQQPYNPNQGYIPQPGVPQPYNPNQAYYSQPPTSQPYQSYQPYQQYQQQQPNTQPPPYYNPGVGVYPTNNVPAQQEPRPAFNPNVDSV